RTGNTGQVVTGVNGAFHNNFFKIKYDKIIMDKRFLYYTLTSDKIQNIIIKLAGASTIPDLNHGDFYKIKSSYPSLLEQEKIANFLSSIDRKIELVEKELERNKEFKNGLLQKMFV
ncbi:MAG: restriction endonuclease subunit S, partial [Fusobacteriaceae bacterium]